MSVRRWLAVPAVVAALVSPARAQSPLRPDLGSPWLVNGQLQWPPNDGCAGDEVSETLPVGTKIDRYGSDHGSFFAVPGTPYEARALPYDPAKLPYTVYVVEKPLAVLECRIAGWFGEPGGGEQFKAAEPAALLTQEGVIAPQ